MKKNFEPMIDKVEDISGDITKTRVETSEEFKKQKRI